MLRGVVVGEITAEHRPMMPGKMIRKAIVLSAFVLAVIAPLAAEARDRWTEAQATAWAAHQPWVTGGNFLPSNAINQLEMWQADTFDPVTIDRELGWAEGVGMKTMRVFLHDLLWQQDQAGMQKRMDTFL